MPKIASYFKSKQYQNLIEEVQAILAQDVPEDIIDFTPTRLKNYWQIGHKMHLIQQKFPDLQLNPSSEDMARLAQDFRTTPSNLYKMVSFKRSWPQAAPIQKDGRCLNWARHCELLSVKEEKARNFYHQEALKHDWSRDTLRHAIRLKLFNPDQKNKTRNRIPEQNVPFYTYRAALLRVLDGDTLEVKVDLGFKLSSELMLRLRGINTPELHHDPTGRALKAKQRLEEILSKLEFVVLKTYKTDVYGRYLTDVYYHPTLKDQHKILREGFFLNQLMLDEGLADWLVM